MDYLGFGLVMLQCQDGLAQVALAAPSTPPVLTPVGLPVEPGVSAILLSYDSGLVHSGQAAGLNMTLRD